jgi:uncharacterized protein YeaO (DUF488 family)
MLKLKCVYEPASREDGQRFLVERLWPRGVKKTSLDLGVWLKDVAPSAQLRQWFSHDPKKWGEFQRRCDSRLQGRTGTRSGSVRSWRRCSGAR